MLDECLKEGGIAMQLYPKTDNNRVCFRSDLCIPVSTTRNKKDDLSSLYASGRYNKAVVYACEPKQQK